VRFCSSFVFALLPLMYLSRRRRRSPPAGADAPGGVDYTELSLPGPLDRLMDLVMRLDEWLIAAGVSLPAGGSLLMVAERTDG